MLPASPIYDGREQTYLKHYLLEEYLFRFTRIIGSWSPSITYVDSFAGPWESRDVRLRDTSFAIAAACLRGARVWVQEKFHRTLRVRCLFLEKNKSRFRELMSFTEALRSEGIEAHALSSEFEEAIPQVLDFIDQARGTFTFFFIDPTGWTGFSLEAIAPLLSRQPNEVLINFMTSHIRRFLETETSSASFERLFGRDVRRELKGLDGEAREEKAVREYMRSLKRAGDFLYVGTAIVYKPEIDTPQFHLIYGTRNHKGVKKFKEVEKKLFPVAAAVRASAKERKEFEKTKQMSLLDARELHPPSAMTERRSRYLRMAYERVRAKLSRDKRVKYGVIWRMALAYPLVWEDDLRTWLDEWKAAGDIAIPTLTGRRRVADPDKDMIEWLA